jgi:phosphoribosylamine--glycine ligase
MGAVSPVPFVNKDFIGKVEERIIRPTLQGLQQEQAPYCGFIFLGLMNVNGDPYVIEYNVRMGDPETQAVFARIESDLLELLDATAAGTLKHQSLQISPYTAVTVVLASQGYPQTYEKDKVIEGFDEVEEAIIFHAGTRQDGKGQILTAGGRVLAVTSLAETLPEARQLAMKAAATIRFSNKYYRRDIGLDLERYEQEAEASRQN